MNICFLLQGLLIYSGVIFKYKRSLSILDERLQCVCDFETINVKASDEMKKAINLSETKRKMWLREMHPAKKREQIQKKSQWKLDNIQRGSFLTPLRLKWQIQLID